MLRRKIVLVFLALLMLCLFLPVAGRADDVETQFNKGVALYREKKYEAALEAFGIARKAAPKNPDVLNWIGFIHLQQQQFAAALEPLEQAAKIRPDSPETFLNLGNVYDGLKRYPDALRAFQTVAKLQPKSADPHYNLGSVYYKMKKWTESVTAYKKAALLSPNDPYIHDSLGSSLQAAGDFAGAIAAHTKATEIAPDNVNFWLNLGLAAQAEGRSQQAKSGTSAKMDAAKAWGTARTALQKAVQLAPAAYMVRETFAEALADMGKAADAVPQFEKAAQLDAKQFDPHYNLGLVHGKLGHLAESTAAYKKALELRPDSKMALHGLGLSLFRQQLYDEAAKIFTDLTKAAPTDMVAWINLSSCQQRKGDEDAAIATLEEAVKQKAKGAGMGRARRALAAYYYRKGDADSLKRAEEQYTASLTDSPDNADAYNGLGLVAQKQSKPDDAIKNFKKAVALNPKYADALNNLGVAYEAKGNKEEAVAAYKKALQADPTNALAKKNLARADKP